MFGKQQFVGRIEGKVTDKYDIIKVIIINLSNKKLNFLIKNLSFLQEIIQKNKKNV